MTSVLDTYTKDEFVKLFSLIDEATAANLYDYFKYRDVKPNLPHFLHQKELLYAEQYKKLLRDESVTYDAMVTDYIERLTTRKEDTSQTSSQTTDEKTTGKTNSTITTDDSHTGTISTETHNSNDRTIEQTNSGTSTEKTSGHTTDTDDTKGITKSNPYQNEYTASAGTIPALDWTTSDGQQESISDKTGTTEESTEGSTSDTQNGTVSDKGGGTGSETRSLQDKGSTVQNGGSEGSKEGSTSVQAAGSTTGRDTERYSGRHGYSPAELLSKSADYIYRTKAFAWLCEKFSGCFTWIVEV